jgi:type II secretory pathway pseudopilin PulG
MTALRPALRPPCRTSAGFSYIALLIALVLISVASTAPVQLGALVERRAAEEELLAIGNEFRNAFISFGNASPVGQNRQPRNLEDLIKDPRYPNTVRHLRKIFVDPITGKAEWGLVPAIDGRGIIGVHSLSMNKPIKIANFEIIYQSFSLAATYRDWRFLGAGNNVGQPGNPNQAPPPPSGDPQFPTR